MDKRRSVSPAVCDPSSDASLDTLIDLTQRSAINEEKTARYLIDKIRQLRDAGTWPKQIKSEPRSWERFCREVIGYEADYLLAVERGVSILERHGISNPTVEDAHSAGTAAERSKAAAEATNGKVLPNDGTVNPGNASQFSPHTIAARAVCAGISPAQQKKLDALARKAPDKLTEVRKGTKSVHRACVEAGIVKVPTAFEQVKRLLPKLTRAERIELRNLLTEPT